MASAGRINPASAFWEHHDDDEDSGAANPAVFFELATLTHVPGAHPTPDILALLILHASHQFRTFHRLRRYRENVARNCPVAMQPLALACLRADLGALKRLQPHPVSPTVAKSFKAKGTKQELLHFAALGGNPAVVQWCLDTGFGSLARADARGWPPLLYAVESGNADCVMACFDPTILRYRGGPALPGAMSEEDEDDDGEAAGGAGDDAPDSDEEDARLARGGMRTEDLLARLQARQARRADEALSRRSAPSAAAAAAPEPEHAARPAGATTSGIISAGAMQGVTLPSSLHEQAMRAAARSGSWRMVHWAVRSRFPVPASLALDAALGGDVEVMRRVVLGLGCDLEVVDPAVYTGNVLQALASVASIAGLCFCFDEMADADDRKGKQQNGFTVATAAVESGSIGTLRFCFDVGAGSIGDKGFLQQVMAHGSRKLTRFCTARLAQEQRASRQLEKDKKDAVRQSKYRRFWP